MLLEEQQQSLIIIIVVIHFCSQWFALISAPALLALSLSVFLRPNATTGWPEQQRSSSSSRLLRRVVLALEQRATIRPQRPELSLGGLFSFFNYLSLAPLDVSLSLSIFCLLQVNAARQPLVQLSGQRV